MNLYTFGKIYWVATLKKNDGMVGRKVPKCEHYGSGKMKGIYVVEQGIKNEKTGI